MTAQWSPHACMMAAINITPDSFWQDSRAPTIDHATQMAQTAIVQGAFIIDIGAESTRPNAVPVGAEVEQQRLRPLLAYWQQTACLPPSVLLSIDTYNATTAHMALSLGAHIINDVYGLQRDSQMAEVVAQHNAHVCVMHGAAQALQPDECAVDGVRRSWDISANLAQKAGIPLNRIAFDIGIGFGKTDAQLWQLLRQLNVLVQHVAPCPVVVAASRKSFLGRLLGHDSPQQRLYGTLAVHLLAIQAGARIVRVHDVAEHHDIIKVYNNLL